MKHTFTKASAVLWAAVLIATLTSGCAWSVGSPRKTGTTTQQPTMTPTTGQQLIDLKKALDQGAITPEEYEAQKEKLLD